MITIINTQRIIQIDSHSIKNTVRKILTVLGYADFDVSIIFTTNRTIQAYNKQYRNKDKPTDILSFPYHPHLVAGQKIAVVTREDKNLGDIIMSLAYIKKDAARWNHTFGERIDVLLVHGICHLLGYDHIVDEDYVIMKQKEEYLLAMLWQPEQQ